MNHIFQKNAIEFETRITRHETIRHDSVCDGMRFRIVPQHSTQIRGFLILALFCVQTGIPVLVLYATVLS